MRKKSVAMSLSSRVIIASVLDIAATDSAVYIHLQRNPAGLTLPLLIG